MNYLYKFNRFCLYSGTWTKNFNVSALGSLMDANTLDCLNTVNFFLVVAVKLNGNRVVTGVLRGFDPYMNLVLDEAIEERTATLKLKIGMVVRKARI